MSKDVVWVAEMHTPHFQFTAVGKNKEEAEAGLAKRWNEHAKANNLNRWNQGEGDSKTIGEYYGMWNRPLRFGFGYRDDESA